MAVEESSADGREEDRAVLRQPAARGQVALGEMVNIPKTRNTYCKKCAALSMRYASCVV